MKNYEYEVYVPVYNNKGREYPKKVLRKFRDQLVKRFGGLTDTKFKNKGIWKIGSVQIQDEVVVWRVLSLKERAKDSFMKGLQKQMEKKLAQKSVLIVRREVTVL